MAKLLFDRMVQIRLDDLLRKKMVAKAARKGVHVATWARDAILASRVSSAKVPSRAAGREKITLRFRTSDFKRVSDQAERSGRELSDFLRGILSQAAGRK